MTVRLPKVVVLAIALAGCMTMPEASAPKPSPTRPPLPPAANIRVEPLAGPAKPMARLLAEAVAAELACRGYTARSSADVPADHILRGVVVPQSGAAPLPYPVHVHWRLERADGTLDGRFMHGVAGGDWRWRQGDPTLLRAVGTAAADAVESLVAPPAVRAAPTAPSNGAIAIDAIVGAPGDGASALRAALADALAGSGAVVNSRADALAYVVEAGVSLAPPDEGLQRLELLWTVTAPRGIEIGTIGQRRDVTAGSLDDSWNKTAVEAAETLVPPLMDMIQQFEALPVAARQRAGDEPCARPEGVDDR